MFSNAKNIIDIVKYRWVYMIVSLMLIIPSICAMGYLTMKTGSPLLVGIDFTGGTIIQYSVDKKLNNDDIAKIRADLTKAGIENPVIQVLSASSSADGEAKTNEFISVKTAFDGDKDSTKTSTVSTTIKNLYPEAELVQVSSVGPTLGKELMKNSCIAVLLAILGICAYLSLRFHVEYALIAIFTLVHDVLFVLGVFAFLGIFCNVHVDSLFITAVLTVLGFSVHDTIVVFDRVRENLKFAAKATTFNEVVDASVNQTLARSINTSITTLITLLALYFLGGVTTKDFVLAMILGIAVGTYSSIFFASVLLVFYNNIKDAKKMKSVNP
ncbi:MAG: protein translocase subunit SecF [Candidatus Gastranaerophilales bacterium]|nr:protein translocase subunit SecF [Candidatus Gastranaerophilales bacterium]